MEPVKANDIRIKLFLSDIPSELEENMNSWFSQQKSDTKVYKAEVKFNLVVTNPGELNPGLEGGYLGSIIYQKPNSGKTSIKKAFSE